MIFFHLYNLYFLYLEYLKWKAIKSIVETDNNMSIGVLTLQRTHSKVKKTMEVIIYQTGVCALQRIRKQCNNNKLKFKLGDY